MASTVTNEIAESCEKVNNCQAKSPSAHQNGKESVQKGRGHGILSEDKVLREQEANEEHLQRVKTIQSSYENILRSIGEDPSREGLLKTPQRAAEAILCFTRGYEECLQDVVGDAVFNEDCNNIVIVKDIDVFSLCEHHLVPFYGNATVGYLPNGKIIGLSKIAKIVDMFTHRLQVQERLTRQIADAISEVTGARGVGVVLKCCHMCMTMRGVEKVNSHTLSIVMIGAFQDDAKAREEFMMAVRSH